jgi:hypothetical protein
MPTRKPSPPKPSRPIMPGYGLPETTKGLLPWTWAEQRLKKSHNYWISTGRPDGRPHAMVVWGLWMDGAFYFSTGAQTVKGRNLAHTPYCVIGTENAAEAVVVEGATWLLKDPATRKRFTALYKKKYGWEIANEPVYVMKPEVGFGLYEKKFAQSATRWKFTK